jgi:hypothetical protein
VLAAFFVALIATELAWGLFGGFNLGESLLEPLADASFPKGWSGDPFSHSPSLRL